jgi:hypothetical protein
MELHSFKLVLPSKTTRAEAYDAGLNYIRNTLRLSQYADYRWTGSEPHPTMSRMTVFNYSYKA